MPSHPLCGRPSKGHPRPCHRGIHIQWDDRGAYRAKASCRANPSKIKETPRLCRGGSSSLTFQGVDRRNSDS